MKRIVIAAASLAALLSAMPALAANAPAGYKTFTSQKNHYQIAYPSSWTLRTNKNGQQFFYGTRVRGFSTNVNVYIVPGVKPMHLGKLGTAVASADRREGAQISAVKSGKVGSIQAQMIFGSFHNKKFSGKLVSDRFATAAFNGRGVIWEITYSASPSAYSSTYSTFTKMLSSFALMK